MKKIFYSILAATALMFSSCSDDDKLADITPAAEGTVEDSDGNVYNWVRIGDQDWTTSNARNGESFTEAEYFDGFEWKKVFKKSRRKALLAEFVPVHGNLMTYDEALKSAPEGWRLPTDEDWQKLERTLGMKNTSDRGMRGLNGVGFKMQESDAGCKLGLGAAGVMLREKSFGTFKFKLDYTDEYGMFWTSTVDTESTVEDETMAFYRKITPANAGVGRDSMNGGQYLSVRWVRDSK